MKNIRTLAIGLFLLLVPGLTYSQELQSKTVQEIRKLDQAAAKAVLEKDENAIARFFSKDSVTNNPRSGLTLGSAGVIGAGRSGIIDYYSFDRNIESVQIYGKTAIVMGNEVVVTKNHDGGPANTIRRRYTNVWRKIGKNWQIVARHANIICQ